MDIENTESGRPEAPGTNSEVSGEASKKPDTPGDYFDVLLSGQGPQLYTRVRQPRRVVWSVAWSDLMMTMFILFAVLYIYQAANRDFSFKKQVDADASPDKVTESVAPPQLETTIESAEAFASRMSKQDTDTIRLRNLSDIGKVELKEDKAIRIVLPGDVLFDAGSAELKTSALSTLRLVADAIRLTDYRVNVVGHTDNLPMHSEKFATNWELSAVRACVVARFLIERMKLSPTRFYVSGYAYQQPVAPNDTPGNRAANRRVELILTKKKPASGKG